MAGSRGGVCEVGDWGVLEFWEDKESTQMEFFVVGAQVGDGSEKPSEINAAKTLLLGATVLGAQKTLGLHLVRHHQTLCP